MDSLVYWYGIARWNIDIFSHSIFISVCAAALCFETNIMLHQKPDLSAALLVLFATLCTYNAYCLLHHYFSDQSAEQALYAGADGPDEG